MLIIQHLRVFAGKSVYSTVASWMSNEFGYVVSGRLVFHKVKGSPEKPGLFRMKEGNLNPIPKQFRQFLSLRRSNYNRLPKDLTKIDDLIRYNKGYGISPKPSRMVPIHSVPVVYFAYSSGFNAAYESYVDSLADKMKPTPDLFEYDYTIDDTLLFSRGKEYKSEITTLAIERIKRTSLFVC